MGAKKKKCLLLEIIKAADFTWLLLKGIPEAALFCSDFGYFNDIFAKNDFWKSIGTRYSAAGPAPELSEFEM